MTSNVLHKMKTSKTLATILLTLHITGCSLINGIDSVIPRPVISDKGVYEINLSIRGTHNNSKKFKLERYYDAQASSRGNSWEWRIQGEDYANNLFITGYDKEIGKIRFRFLSTDQIRKKTVKNVRADVIFIGEYTYGSPSQNLQSNTHYRYKNGHIAESKEIPYRIDVTYSSE